MDLKLSGKTAAVVGGANGIGRAVCLVLAEEGANIGVLDLNIEGAEETARMIQENSGKAVGVKVDLADYDSVSTAFKKVVSELGPVDVMVYCDAITDNIATIPNMSLENWNREIDYTLSGAFYCIKQVGEDMTARKWGRLIFVSSRSVSSGAYGRCAYVSTMAGLCGLAKTAALEYARSGITSNLVFPGLVDTPDYQALPDDLKSQLVNKGLMKRLQDPKEVARAIAYLASEHAHSITGAEINITMGGELFVY